VRSIHFTEEHETFRREVRRFVETEIAPHADAWEAARRIPREAFARMGDLGFLGICFPEEYGGSGADIFFAVAFLEELPRSMMGGFCAAVSVQQFMATQHIHRVGSEDLKRDYLVPSIHGRKVGALAITEPDTGSDVAAIRTAAVRVGDEYVVRGAKTFITNGAEGDFYTLAVRTGPGRGASGLSLLVVDADLPGVAVSRRLEKIGWHSSDTAEIAFEDVRVPASRLIGDEGSGFYQIVESFALERIAAAAIAVGSADVALEETLRHMAQRTAFGKPLSRFQALRHRLADLATELEAVRHLTYHAAWLHDRGEPAVRESAMAKLSATELGKRVADECVQFFGGYGFMEEYPVARFFRDARGGTITAGTSEIMREIIARSVFDERADEPAPEPVSEPSVTGRPVPETAGGPTEAAPPVPSFSGPPPPIEDVMRALPDRLCSDRAAGWSSTFHFVLTGADHPDWTVRIEDGTCRVDEGLDGNPDCVVRMKEKTYRGLLDGSVNPRAAFLTGRIKVSSLSEMMRFASAFRLS
jgi:alkylation response protein AidB-like acyl-CoA dehydrogenase/putative sterol carrier protein